MKASGWKWNSRKRNADAARWAGFKTLAEFEKLSKDDQVETVALYEIHWRYEAVNAYEQAEAQKRAMKPKRSGRR